jgi:hypothetical protein
MLAAYLVLLCNESIGFPGLGPVAFAISAKLWLTL